MKVSDAVLLVVDDNEDNRYTLTRRLNREGYANIITANDGIQGLEQLQSKKIDLVLLDVMMPEMNGYEVLERMKADPNLRDIPVIMITAIEEQESIVRCIKLGAEDHLSKPFDPTLLAARVSACLEKKSLRDELHDLNQTLEARVKEQISEIDRMGLLKRFFSPQIAQAILESGGTEMLETHRREIVVVFLDMRGFTAFTDKVEPEEVMEVLAEYHRAMGPLILEESGTLDSFTGDGMMIYFNDPIRLESPVLNAVRMSLAMQRDFVPLREAWNKRGFNLDLGIGIRQGYATLGTIGFEGRWDYTCIGSVTNHSARLCGEAKGGQILTNEKTYARVEELVTAEPLGPMSFKGVAEPVQVVNITGLKP
jgi:class 3 adenylate cyclase